MRQGQSRLIELCGGILASFFLSLRLQNNDSKALSLQQQSKGKGKSKPRGSVPVVSKSSSGKVDLAGEGVLWAQMQFVAVPEVRTQYFQKAKGSVVIKDIGRGKPPWRNDTGNGEGMVFNDTDEVVVTNGTPGGSRTSSPNSMVNFAGVKGEQQDDKDKEQSAEDLVKSSED